MGLPPEIAPGSGVKKKKKIGLRDCTGGGTCDGLGIPLEGVCVYPLIGSGEEVSTVSIVSTASINTWLQIFNSPQVCLCVCAQLTGW